MTPSEGFEAWWKKTLKKQGYPMGEEVWLAACQFQRERDAEIAETHHHEPLQNHHLVMVCDVLNAQRDIAIAIRAQEGG